MKLPIQRCIKLMGLVLTSICLGVFLTLAIISNDEINQGAQKVENWKTREPEVEVGDRIRQLSQNSSVTAGTPQPTPSKSLNHQEETAFQRMQRRRQLINQTCVKTTGLNNIVLNNAYYSKKHSLYYCPVAKTASTFWKRFLCQLDSNKSEGSPYDVPIPIAGGARNQFRLQQQDDKSVMRLLANATKMMFVRDPYSRLYSAYVDKLLAPNPIFWKIWGKPAISKSRNLTRHGKTQQITCGDDVTFLEFVREALSILWKKDNHIIPIVNLCAPCYISYDVIGKMESFIDDTKFLLDSLRINPERFRFNNLKNDFVIDAIKDSATDALSAGWLRSSLKCINMEAVARRVWRKLQLRGFISWRRNFSFTQNQTKLLRSSEFIRILIKENALSTSEEELKLQKRQGMMEAFASLAPSDLKKIESIYSMDFKLYGFDITTFRNIGILGVDVKDTHAFDWRKDWDLSPIL